MGVSHTEERWKPYGKYGEYAGSPSESPPQTSRKEKEAESPVFGNRGCGRGADRAVFGMYRVFGGWVLQSLPVFPVLRRWRG